VVQLTWHITSDVSVFAEQAGEFLRSSPVRHTVPLTVVGTLRSKGSWAYGRNDPILGWWTTGSDEVTGALVQTPPEHRKQSFGGAATSAATRNALDAGASIVVLFTDLANPVSNALYPRLGYQPIEDRAVVEFSR
jgi:RimJ/RimL family protein N-acetyltransferase